jgi:hypothetical protein
MEYDDQDIKDYGFLNSYSTPLIIIMHYDYYSYFYLAYFVLLNGDMDHKF